MKWVMIGAVVLVAALALFRRRSPTDMETFAPLPDEFATIGNATNPNAASLEDVESAIAAYAEEDAKKTDEAFGRFADDTKKSFESLATGVNDAITKTAEQAAKQAQQAQQQINALSGTIGQAVGGWNDAYSGLTSRLNQQDANINAILLTVLANKTAQASTYAPVPETENSAPIKVVPPAAVATSSDSTAAPAVATSSASTAAPAVASTQPKPAAASAPAVVSSWKVASNDGRSWSVDANGNIFVDGRYIEVNAQNRKYVPETAIAKAREVKGVA